MKADPLNGGLLYRLLIWWATLSVILTNVLSQTESDMYDAGAYIQKTLHYQETLRFDVERLFPKLTKDLRISYQDPAVESQRPLMVTQPVELMYESQLNDLQDCTKLEPLNYSHIQLICNNSREYKVVSTDHSSRKTEVVLTHVVPANESIYTFHDVADLNGTPFVYIISNISSAAQSTNNMIIRLLKFVGSEDGASLRLKLLAELPFNYPLSAKLDFKGQEAEEYWIRTTRCPNDEFVGLTSCTSGSASYVLLFPHQNVRPRSNKLRNMPEALGIQVIETVLSDNITLKLEGLFLLENPEYEDPYPQSDLPRRKIKFDFNPANDWYMSMMPSPTGVWILYNSLGDETAAFSIANCTFVDFSMTTADPPTVMLDCKGDIASDFAPLCRNTDLELMNFGTNYWAGISNNKDLTQIDVYLLTNCMLSKLSYNKSNGEPMGLPKNIKLPYLVQNFPIMDKSANQILGFVKSSEGSNKAYLMTVPDLTETVRFYQTVNFTSRSYTFCLDSAQIDDEIIIAYDFDEESNSSTLSYYTMVDEMIITNSTAMEALAPTTFVARAVGESNKGEQISYEFSIKVVKDFGTVDYSGAFGEFWYYNTEDTAKDRVKVIVPLDNTRLHGNDLKLTSGNPSRVNITRSQYQMRLEHDNVWHINERKPDGSIVYDHDKTLKNASDIISMLTYQNFLFVTYSSGSVSVYKCGDTADASGNSSFVCSELASNIPKPQDEELVAKAPEDSIAVRYRNGTYCISLIWVSPERVYVYTVNIQPKHQPEIIVHSFNLLLAVNSGNLLYTKRGLMFAGVGYMPQEPSKMLAITCNLEMAKQRSDFQIRWLVSYLFTNTPPNLQFHSFTCFDDDNFAVILKDTMYFFVIYVNIDEESLRAVPKEPILVSKVKYTYLGVTSNRILIQRSLNGADECSYGFLSDLESKLGTYIGELPVPCGPNHTIQRISDNHGIVIFVVLDSSDPLVPAPGVLVAYAFDFRFVSEDPLDRLLFVRKLITPVAQLNNTNGRSGYFIDSTTFDLHMVAFLDDYMTRLTVNLHGSPNYIDFSVDDQFEKVSLLPVKITSNLPGSQQAKTGTLVMRATQFDWSVVATPQQSKVVLNDSIQSPVVKKLEECIAITGHVKNISILKSGKELSAQEDSFIELVGLLTPLPVTFYGSYSEALARTPLSSDVDYNHTYLSLTDTAKVALGQSLIISGQKNFTVWRFMDDQTLHLVLDQQHLRGRLLHTFINHESRSFDMIGKKGPIVWVSALVEGDYEFSDLYLYVIDSTNKTVYRKEVVKNFCRCDKVRFEMLNRLKSKDEFTLGLFYREFSDNGTTWTSSRLVVTPRDRSHPDSVLAGFDISRPQDPEIKTFKLKPIEASEYGILKPDSRTVMAYYFFENSGKLGLFYRGPDQTLFSYHQFSKTCFPVTADHVACKLFEADVEINCMVQCDMTRILNFKVRIHVDDIEATGGSMLSGVELIDSPTSYKLPVGYQILKLIKGDKFDLVLARLKDKNLLLMYDQGSGFIVSISDEADYCQNVMDPGLRSSCNFTSSFIYSLPNNRWIMVSRNMHLSRSFYIKSSAQIIFRPAALAERKAQESVKDYQIRVIGLRSTSYLRLDTIVDLGLSKGKMVWVFLGITLAMITAGLCVLVIYQNWRADEELKRRLTFQPGQRNENLLPILKQEKLDVSSRRSIESDNSAKLMRSRKNARMHLTSILDTPTK